jgi:hypothetical protein
MVKHEYSIITGSNYTCNEIDKKQLIIPGYRTKKKKNKNGKSTG